MKMDTKILYRVIFSLNGHPLGETKYNIIGNYIIILFWWINMPFLDHT
jgi:hypothetical protein